MNTPSPTSHTTSRSSAPDYFLAGANIVIACAGPETPRVFPTRFGELRSRNGALLTHTSSDAKGIHKLWREDSPDDLDHLHVLLIDPTIAEVESAIARTSSRLRQEDANTIGLDLFFAGHGAPDTGNLVLRDGELSPHRFLELQARDVRSRGERRRIGLLLDSCYSGAFLVDLAIRAFRDFEEFRFDGSLASCLPDEESFEMDILDHGVFTYTQLYYGNKHVDNKRFNQAILNNDADEIAKGIQGLVAMNGSSPTAFLTEGKQFPLVMNKTTVEVQGGFAEVDLYDHHDMAEVSEQLTRFKGVGTDG